MMRDDEAVTLLVAARRILGVSQGELGELLGSSRRTGQRWETTGTKPSDEQWLDLAARILPQDRQLATALALAGGGTIQALEATAAATTGAPVAAPAPLPPEVVDSIVCAAAETMNVTPGAIRPALVAAFSRAQRIGLSVEQVTRALARE